MHPISLPRLVLKRIADSRLLLGSIFASIAIATTLAAAAPVSLIALERLSLNLAIDRLVRPFSNINVFVFNIPLTKDELRESEGILVETIDQNLSHIYDRHERFLVVDTYLAGTPSNPLPESRTSGRLSSRGYFRYFSNLESHVTFQDGRMAGAAVRSGPHGQEVEAVVSQNTAGLFSLKVDDVIVLTQSLGSGRTMSARIVGILYPTDPGEDYWLPNASVFLDPPPPDEPDEGEPPPYDPGEPPVPLFVTQEALSEAVSSAFPGTLVDSLWFILTDTERLKAWSVSETRNRITRFDNRIISTMPGSEIFSGITKMVDEFEKRSFFSRVPLLMLLAVMLVTVLFYLSMTVSYLVQSREGDVALLRTRGVGTLELLRLYALEGLLMTVVAVALAPFLAMGLVALAGKLPYFQEMTHGGLLPVRIGPVPFLVAGAAALLCVTIFVLPGALGVRGGILLHKLKSSRPPTTPFFHRYYLDVALLVLGGLTFWELSEKGHILSGGLFKDVNVNEVLLFAPILFLVVVALVFLRVFPLLVRFISGESPALSHIAGGATVLALVSALIVRQVREGNGVIWLGPAVLVLAFAGAYWMTMRAQKRKALISGLILQAGLVAAFLALEPPETGEVLFVPTIGLIFLVPIQILFLTARLLTRSFPVWLSLGLWHMARNPLQYTWLVLLLVLVTGVGILSTTVGATLDRSQEERVLYEVAGNVRITGLDGGQRSDSLEIKDRYLAVPGVTSGSLALRTTGSAGPASLEILAVESREFSYISWYRDDFSERPLGGLMQSLQARTLVDKVEIPEGATSIGVWAKPQEEYSNVSLWMVIEDQRGVMRTLTMGKLGPPEWHTIRVDIPSDLEQPLYLASVQIFEPGLGATGTPGSVFLDDFHVLVGPDGQEHVVEDFEGQMIWTPIITSALSSDRLSSTTRDMRRGNRAALFSFSRETVRGIRGFYHSPTAGPMPVVASSSFSSATGTQLRDEFMLEVDGRAIPVVLMDTVEYFPSISQDVEMFMLVDLNTLLSHMNVLSFLSAFGQMSRVSPNEIFLSANPAFGESVRESLMNLVPFDEQLRDRSSLLEKVRLDPLATAGWRSMVLLSLSIVILAAGLGYVTHLLSFSARSKSEMGLLQSLGLSRRQLMGLVGFEHLSVVAMGVGLGTWAGFQMSTLMVSSVAVTEFGEEVVPPFILMTDWSLMGPTFLALGTIFLAVLLAINRTIRGLDLHVLSRLEGV